MTYEELKALVEAKPANGTPEKIAAWKERVGAARHAYQAEHTQLVRKQENQWKPGEWDRLQVKLERLSLDQLRKIADQVGIHFTDGNEKIEDKEEFILVLDEADKENLYRAYGEITGSE